MKKSQAQILDGKKIASEIREALKVEIGKMKKQPGLAVVLLGNDDASRSYIEQKRKACEEVGIEFTLHELDVDVKQEKIIQFIKKLNKDKKVHGIIVQLPLPKEINTDEVIQEIDPTKDADGFHPENLKLLNDGKPRVIAPTHVAILRLIDETKIELTDKQVVLMTNSLTFAGPLKTLLEQRGTKVESVFSHEGFLSLTEQADVLVVALGQPKAIKAKDIKEHSAVIDVGFNRVEGKLVGDIDADSVQSKAGYLSPVPGGVGPLTVVYLLKNVIELASA